MNSGIDALHARLARVFGEVFDNESMEFSIDLSRETLEGWDSLGHIRLIGALEEEFGVQLTIEEIERLTSVRSIAQRLADER